MVGIYKKIRQIAALSFQLAKVNFKLRNEGSALGILWYLLEPLIFFIMFLFLGNVVNTSPIPSYPLYLLLGLLMFNFFSSATLLATSTIHTNAGIIKSVKINSEVFVFAIALQLIFSHIIEMFILFIVMLLLRVNPLFIFFYPLVFLFFLLLVTGLSLILASISAYFTDLENIWIVMNRLLMFATPIFYVALVPKNPLSLVNFFNPLTHFLNVARSIVIYHQLPTLLASSGLVILSLVTFIIGLSVFNRFKNSFAEYI